VTESLPSSAAQIPNTETDSAPEVFREGPTVAISAAVSASPTVKLVLNGAQIALAARADKFTQEVGVKAVEFAGDRRAIAVDVPDVTKAAETLFPAKRDPGSPWSWGVLGILAGAVVSFLITVLAPGIPAEWMPLAVAGALLLLVGCAIWAIRLIIPSRAK
jgi:hypothetical protein